MPFFILFSWRNIHSCIVNLLWYAMLTSSAVFIRHWGGSACPSLWHSPFFYHPKRCAMFWNGFSSSWFFCTIFSFCVMFDFLFYVPIAFRFWRIKKNIYVGVFTPFPPSKPPVFVGGSATRPRMLLDWISLANWLSGVTGSESGFRLQKLLEFPVHYECLLQNRR